MYVECSAIWWQRRETTSYIRPGQEVPTAITHSEKREIVSYTLDNSYFDILYIFVHKCMTLYVRRFLWMFPQMYFIFHSDSSIFGN